MNSNLVVVASATAAPPFTGCGTLVGVPAAYSLVETRDLFRSIARWLPARLRPATR